MLIAGRLSHINGIPAARVGKECPAVMIAKEAPTSQLTNAKNTNSVIARSMTGTGALIAAMWALITYVFPDPTIFGFGFLNWKNVIMLISAFTLFSTLTLGWKVRGLPSGFRNFFHTLLATLLAVLFFIFGSEYARPTFEFAKNQSDMIENEGPNLLGKRVEVIANIRSELVGCETIGESPRCTFDLTNLISDRELRVDSTSKIFNEYGGVLTLKGLLVGDREIRTYEYFPLVRKAPTRVTLIFQTDSRRITQSPAVKLTLKDPSIDLVTLKYANVLVQ